MVSNMLGFAGMPLTIEKCTGKDLRGIPTYAPPITKDGYIIIKNTYNYQTNQTIPFYFITFQEPSLVQKEDKVNGKRVETVKDVYIDGEFIVSEVTAV